jgi:integrase
VVIASYLRRTSGRGNYSYRRAIPEDCRPLWGKREHKVSLKTKSHPEALRRAAQVNTEFDSKVARIRQMNSGLALPTDQQIQEAKDILFREGIHPQQIPRTKAEADKFFERQKDWSGQYIDTIDTENGYNPDGSIWTTYHENKKSPYYLAHEILKGRQTASLVPTLGEATDTYLKVNAEKAKRTPHNQRKHEQRVRRAVAQLGPPDTQITDFNRLKARQHKEALLAQNPTWSNNTLDRAITILSAAFASAILEYELAMTNPWLGLTASVGEKDDSTSEDRKNKRRSFTPDELFNYQVALSNLNEEARLIGYLMIQTGCRTMEAGGLLVKDVMLDTNTPHIQIRYNRIRKLKTKNSVRDVPIVGPLLDDLRDYLTKHQSTSPDAPLFPKYGRDGGMDAVSTLLRGVIRKRLKIADPTLVPYSSRHTMKDKLRTLRTPEDIQHRILGHGSKSDADGYGDGNPLAHLQQVLVKADLLDRWGL